MSTIHVRGDYIVYGGGGGGERRRGRGGGRGGRGGRGGQKAARRIICINFNQITMNDSVMIHGAGGIPDKSWKPQLGIIDTSMGQITIELYWDHAPETCRNFAELCRRGYYNNTKFHRIIRNFMIQGGDPTSTGRGGTSIYGTHFDDEIHDDLRHTGAGIVSMANSGPNTNGSQFFITLAPTQWLDKKHTIFGRVHSGMNVVKRMGMVETDKNDRPVDDVKILKGGVQV